jgi:hypothetical protein
MTPVVPPHKSTPCLTLGKVFMGKPIGPEKVIVTRTSLIRHDAIIATLRFVIPPLAAS